MEAPINLASGAVLTLNVQSRGHQTACNTSCAAPSYIGGNYVALVAQQSIFRQAQRFPWCPRNNGARQPRWRMSHQSGRAIGIEMRCHGPSKRQTAGLGRGSQMLRLSHTWPSSCAPCSLASRLRMSQTTATLRLVRLRGEFGRFVSGASTMLSSPSGGRLL